MEQDCGANMAATEHVMAVVSVRFCTYMAVCSAAVFVILVFVMILFIFFPLYLLSICTLCLFIDSTVFLCEMFVCWRKKNQLVLKN